MKRYEDIVNLKTTILIFIFSILVFSACRKDVTLDLPEYQEKIVIEGGIETGSPAVVFLSYSVPYFGDFDYTTPEKAFIKGGDIRITDGIKSEKLIEVNPSSGYLYTGLNIKGVEGKTYTITVTVDGKTFETSTTILKPVKLDTIFFMSDRDSLGYVYQTFTEPLGSGDCYRWFAKRLGKDAFYASPFNSVFDDKFVDGKTFDFGYERGPQPGQAQQNREDNERGYYKRGDTVVVKFCKIGRREYDFWFTYYQNKASNGNPFSAPANVKSMFENYKECFGSFVGYSPRFDTIVLQ